MPNSALTLSIPHPPAPKKTKSCYLFFFSLLPIQTSFISTNCNLFLPKKEALIDNLKEEGISEVLTQAFVDECMKRFQPLGENHVSRFLWSSLFSPFYSLSVLLPIKKGREIFGLFSFS